MYTFHNNLDKMKESLTNSKIYTLKLLVLIVKYNVYHKTYFTYLF